MPKERGIALGFPLRHSYSWFVKKKKFLYNLDKALTLIIPPPLPAK